jgi:peptide/nickel transport system substrate-binding protein
MHVHRRPRFLLPLALSALVVTCAMGQVVGATRSAPVATAASPHYITATNQTVTTWVRNFNPFLTTSLEYNTGGIYEPLILITTAGGGHVYPWLATGYRWTDGYKTLLLTIRHGVTWSDGVPFTAKDVVFTLTYGKTYPAADQNGLWAGGFLQSVNQVGADQVAVHFKTVNTTALPYVVSNIRIIPQHIWATIKNPGTYTNPNPVGTGPFTRVIKFTGQQYILGRNPHYWQKGKPAADGINVPVFTGADSANLALAHGDVDWTQNFVPNAQTVYVKKDPAHNHYFFATNTAPNGLYFNDQKYPYSLVGFRKAISYAIDRQKVYLIGEYGYEPPADAIGVINEWPSWADKSLQAQAKELATYNPAKAKALLASLGFKLKSGHLYDPRGHRVAIQLAVVNGWSDWVQSLQIIQQNLQALGIDATVKLMDQIGWQDKANKGLLDAHLQWENNGASPYYYFYGFMSKESYVPTGQDASLNGQTNWERWYSPEATTLLAQFRQTTDSGTQHAIVDKLQKIQLDNLPFIPVMYNALWYTYGTARFTGWPTPSNYYAIGGPGNYPDELKVMTTVTPVK